jgi:hypothetical protein
VCVFTHDAAHVQPGQMDGDSATYCHCRVFISKLYMKFSHWDYVLGELIRGMPYHLSSLRYMFCVFGDRLHDLMVSHKCQICSHEALES